MAHTAGVNELTGAFGHRCFEKQYEMTAMEDITAGEGDEFRPIRQHLVAGEMKKGGRSKDERKNGAMMQAPARFNHA